MLEPEIVMIQTSRHQTEELMFSNMKQIRRGYNTNNQLRVQASSDSVDDMEEVDSFKISEEVRESDGVPESQAIPAEMYQESVAQKSECIGFSNEVWRQRALLIIYFITKFITIMLTNSEKFKFNYLDKKLVSAINDPTADYNFYLKTGLIRQKYKKKKGNIVILYLKQSGCARLMRYLLVEVIMTRLVVLQPEHSIKIMWDGIVFLTLLVNIIYLPLKVAFQFEVPLPLDVLPRVFYILDILLTFNTAYYSHGVLVLNHNQIARHYLKQHFLQDMLSCIPIFVKQFTLLEILQLVRIHRLSDIMENLEDSFNLRTKFAALIDVTKLLFFFLFVCHLIACSWYYISVLEQQNGYNLTWLIDAGLDHAPLHSRYIAALYWSFVTTLTIGYGDIVPQTDPERCFFILVGLISSLTFGFTISAIGNIFGQISEQKKQTRDKMSLINFVLSQRGIKKELQVKVRKFFEYYFEMNQEKDKQGLELFKNISSNLQKEIKADIYKRYLLKSQLFQNFSKEFIEALCFLMQEKSMIPGETIIVQNEVVTQLHFVIKGEASSFLDRRMNTTLALDRVGLKQLKQINKGFPIGEISFFSQNKSKYNAKAMQFTRLAFITYQDFMQLLHQYPIDLQKYQQIKNQIWLKEQCSFLGCEFCTRRHEYTRCPFLFYRPDIDKVVKKQYKETQKRRFLPRNVPRKTTKTLFHLAQNQEHAFLLQVQENLVQEQEIDDKYLNKIGMFNKQVSNTSKKKAPGMSGSQDNESEVFQPREDDNKRFMNYITLLSPRRSTKDLDQQQFQHQDVPPDRQEMFTRLSKTHSLDNMTQLHKDFFTIFTTNAEIDTWKEFENFYPSNNISQILENLRQVRLIVPTGFKSRLGRILSPSQRRPSTQVCNRRKGRMLSLKPIQFKST